MRHSIQFSNGHAIAKNERSNYAKLVSSLSSLFSTGTTVVMISLISFAISSKLIAQSTISGIELSNNKKSELFLDNLLSDYKIYDIRVLKNNVKISSASPLMNLKLGEKIYELNLYQDNLSTDYKGTNLPLLLGGSL